MLCNDTVRIRFSDSVEVHSWICEWRQFVKLSISWKDVVMNGQKSVVQSLTHHYLLLTFLALSCLLVYHGHPPTSVSR